MVKVNVILMTEAGRILHEQIVEFQDGESIGCHATWRGMVFERTKPISENQGYYHLINNMIEIE